MCQFFQILLIYIQWIDLLVFLFGLQVLLIFIVCFSLNLLQQVSLLIFIWFFQIMWQMLYSFVLLIFFCLFFWLWKRYLRILGVEIDFFFSYLIFFFFRLLQKWLQICVLVILWLVIIQLVFFRQIKLGDLVQLIFLGLRFLQII